MTGIGLVTDETYLKMSESPEQESKACVRLLRS